MKKLLFLLLFPVLALCQTVNVTPASDVRAVVQAQKAGAVVVFAAGVYNIPNVRVPVGVTLKGQGVGATIIRTTMPGMEWRVGGFSLDSPTQVDGNQVIEGFSMEGGGRNYSGIRVTNRNKVTIRNVHIKEYYESGIEIGGEGGSISNLLIESFHIENSSNEYPGQSKGNIQINCALTDAIIRNGKIIHTEAGAIAAFPDKKRSGYGIKAIRSRLTRVVFTNIEFQSKAESPYANGDTPNFNIELWNGPCFDVTVSHCLFDSEPSFEYAGQEQVGKTLWVHNNTFRCQLRHGVEFNVPFAIMEYNRFEMQNSRKLYEIIFSSNKNKNIRGQIVRYNTFITPSYGTNIWATNAQIVGALFHDNVIEGNGALIKFWGGSEGSSITFRNNTVPQGMAKATYAETANTGNTSFSLALGTAVIPPGQTPPIVTPPVIAPPVVTPPVVTPVCPPCNPVTIRDTVYKEVVKTVIRVDTVYKDKPVYIPQPYPVYYDPVMEYDSTSNSYIIRRKLRK